MEREATEPPHPQPNTPRAPSWPDPGQPDGGANSSILMRYRDQNGQDWADIIDFLTMHPDAGRGVVGSWEKSKRRADSCSCTHRPYLVACCWHHA